MSAGGMLRCSGCETDNPGGARFCGQCGRQLALACRSCGSAVPHGNRFCGQCGVALAEPGTPPPAPAPFDSGPSHGDVTDSDMERRQITILFVDLVGSTRLSQRFDPEVFGQLIRDYRIAVVDAIERFGGRVARYLGDALLVYFGYPRAHENDALRAVRAGLAIVQALRERADVFTARYGEPVKTRIGIHTGLVLVGQFASGARIEAMSVLGEVPNIAARLQEIATPETVVIGPTTSRLVSAMVRQRSLGPVRLKGIEQAVEVFEVQGLAADLPDRALDPVLTRMYGRVEEAAHIAARWRETLSGSGRVVVLTGEAGVGKSRLVREFWNEIAGSGAAPDAPAHRWLDCSASAFDGNTAFAPIAAMLRETLRRHDRDPARAADIAHLFPAPEAHALVADLLEVADAPVDAIADWTAARRRRSLLDLLADWLTDAGRHDGEPASVLAIEDYHWLDASTRELIGVLVPRVAERRAMVLVTSRPIGLPPWESAAHVSTVRLGPLPAEDTAAMIRDIARERPVSPVVLTRLTERTDGIPLYVEELTRAALGRAPAATPAPVDDAVPDTLRDALMERFDQLASARGVLQLGAVIGRTFTPALIRGLSALTPGRVEAALDTLVEAGMLLRRGTGAEASYAFRHALIRDVAYQTLLVSRRQELHRALADHLTAAGAAQDDPGTLAHHLGQSGDEAAAIALYLEAGRRAHRHGALIEADGHLQSGHLLLPRVADAHARRLQELDITLERGSVSIALRGYGAPDVERFYTRAVELGRGLGDDARLYAAYWGQSSFFTVHGPFTSAHETTVTMLRLAESTNDPLLVAEGHRRLGLIAFMQGRLPAAAAGYDRAFAHFARCEDAGQKLFGTRPLILNWTNRAWLTWFLGAPDRAVDQIRHAASLAESAADPYAHVFALGVEASIRHLIDDVDGVAAVAEACARISAQQVFTYWESWGAIFAGWAAAVRGDAGGFARITEAHARYRETGAIQFDLYARTLLGDAHLRCDQPDQAIAVLDEALRTADATARYILPLTYTVRARVRLSQGRRTDAIMNLRQAASAAVQQGSPMLEIAARQALMDVLPAAERADEAARIAALKQTVGARPG